MLVNKNKIFKRLTRYATYTLVLGAILILGFLSFSGIYVLIPILAIAISAFLLSVIFEGEILYKIFNKAIKSLTKPHYIESKLAEECLQEAIAAINADYELMFSIEQLLEKIDLYTEKDDIIIKKYAKIIQLIERQKSNSKLKKIRVLLEVIPTAEECKEYLNEKTINKMVNYIPGITFAEQTNKPKHNFKNKLSTLRQDLVSELNIPQFFIDYAQIATLDHTFTHINPTTDAEKHKQTLGVSLNMLEQIFTEQLFPHTATSPSKQTENDEEYNVFLQTQEYKKKLRAYLEDLYVDKYNKMLPKRKTGSKLIKVLSSICACFMILGTSYLLVEAFAVVPLLATIPFGILPAIIVPLAVIAGIAYGIQTYRALDELLNSDIITKRLAKIREDLKNGLNFYTATKLFIFFLLLALTITLTVCTGGTWYTVVKYTRPIFSWLSKIPAAISGVIAGVIAGVLAISACAFNFSNTMQTTDELEEAFESQVPEDNPYNIDLFEADSLEKIEPIISDSKRTAIIKIEGKYYIHCCPNQSKQWERIEVSKNSYLLNTLLNRLNFSNNILYYSVANTALYSLIRQNTKHKFNPSKENWTQFLNPFRIILLFTYVPIRILFFLGHLASISATSDRIPGIPEIISIIIGFIAELFEDLHYFTSFNHNHKTDLPSIVAEHFQENDSCEHANDLPTRIIRDYLFAPLFWAAAKWHSYYSNKETGTETSDPNKKFEDSLEKLHGRQPKSYPNLKSNDADFVKQIEDTLCAEEESHTNNVEDKSDLINIPTSRENLLKTLISAKPRVSPLSIFANHESCFCHPRATTRNQMLRP